jgi:hypothetical protein
MEGTVLTIKPSQRIDLQRLLLSQRNHSIQVNPSIAHGQA